MSVLQGPSKLELIPWDYNSPDHVERAYLQRVACGWRSEEIPDWIEKCKKGVMNVYFLVLSSTVPDREALIAKHIAKYPNEQNPLKDTSPSAWPTTNPRTPTNTPIHPIGHIAIVLPPPEELLPLGLPPKGVAYIGKLYVSYALQAHGFGGIAMRQVEAIAREQLGCEVAFLDTLPADYQMQPKILEEFYGARGNPVPKISNEKWYVKMGYEIFHKVEKGYDLAVNDSGERIWTPVLYFKKALR